MLVRALTVVAVLCVGLWSAPAFAAVCAPPGTDNDGDGIDDVDEDLDGSADCDDDDLDGDSVPNYLDIDDDGDGIRTAVERSAFHYLDPDSDDDGVPDLIEGHDVDGDHVADTVPSGNDGDGDGLDDTWDPDNGGTFAVLPDRDNDGIPDFLESGLVADSADADGVSPELDCDETDPTIYVGATEIPGDSIDQNCDGVDAFVVADLGPGDLVITEIMQNPSGTDTAREWFEIYNNFGDTVDLNGLYVYDQGLDDFVVAGPLVVPAGTYVVFGGNNDVGTNGGVTLDYLYSGFTLANTTDQIYLATNFAKTTIIDGVAWDAGATFPDPDGASMAFEPTFVATRTGATDNDSGAYWCEGRNVYGDGDLGTPGAANDSCGDLDSDGYLTPAFGGRDCDGNNGAINPGVDDVPGNDVDENCDDRLHCYVDGDDDGFGAGSGAVTAYTATDGMADTMDACASSTSDGYDDTNDDCVDEDAAINPDATDTPGDDVDENCSNTVACYVDGDNDGFGAGIGEESPHTAVGGAARTSDACNSSTSDGYDDTDDDCADGDNTVFPGASETCGDGIDSDCGGDGGPGDDEDGDGLSWTEEDAIGTSECDDDTDDDGVVDSTELSIGTSPIEADSDGDGLSDGLELGLAVAEGNDTASTWVADTDTNTTTDPNDADTDDDGLLDGDEDADADGAVDAVESDPNNVDTDADGLCDGAYTGSGTVTCVGSELTLGTSAWDADTDDDGLTDGVEDPDGDGVDAGETDPLDDDSDNDGTLDGADGCPLDGAKTAAGVCACGTADTDTDGDTTADCNDGCPGDAGKIAAGQCGCGVSDADGDLDGVPDCLDNCPVDGNPTQADGDADGIGDACEADGPSGGAATESGCGCSSAPSGGPGLLGLALFLRRRRRG